MPLLDCLLDQTPRSPTASCTAVRSLRPPELRPAGPLPSEATVSVAGPWARRRTLDPAALGPLRLDLSRAVPGVITWYLKPAALHLSRGVRVDAVHPRRAAWSCAAWSLETSPTRPRGQR